MKDDTNSWRRQKKIKTENSVFLIGVLGTEKKERKKRE